MDLLLRLGFRRTMQKAGRRCAQGFPAAGGARRAAVEQRGSVRVNSLLAGMRKATLCSSFGNTRQWILLVAVLLVVLGIFSVSRKESPQDAARPDIPANVGIITVAFGNEHGTRSFAGPALEGMTVAHALAQSGKAGGFAVVLDENGRPRTVNGVTGSWRVLKNGVEVEGSLRDVPFVPGDDIRFVPVSS